jgi:hypothetical protein
VSEEAESYSVPYVEPLSDARTMLADLVNSLLASCPPTLNNVEIKPYRGYPQFYDVKITQLIEQVNPGGQVWNVRVERKHHAPYGVTWIAGLFFEVEKVFSSPTQPYIVHESVTATVKCRCKLEMCGDTMVLFLSPDLYVMSSHPL